ncbi:tRNA modification GTPase GTPBP3, mitochondrial-like isoform X2 [Portunus trituberculatus]|uniref:tRNA modification GTPase GTPBP3, mitochondrial-like isoform X2 n=1 Tax=Portunus trituberculatus TaxID=210409 RepID=UPI001E1CDFF1|nr:tRNA modification GTPase GTPBP3, mitochondrial-like isoform X2 [Portunus trituberculatus]
MLRIAVRGTVRQQSALLAVHWEKPIKCAASTVFALSSGQGKCGVGVVRVSGDQASSALTSMTHPATLPRPRTATLRRIVHPTTGEALDRALVLWFPGPQSFTGEDSCELHIHGGPAVIAAVLAALGTLPGYVPAQPGDFTKRAFYQGKLDLTSVEGLGDLIHAETEAQRKQALQQMEGALAHLYTGWRQSLLQCRASLEAYIDFSEDENIEEGVVEEVRIKLQQLVQDLQCHLADSRRGERLRSGLQLAILGQPNVGKSSLLNALTQRPTAIVSPIPGTTRDVVQTVVDLGGYPVVLSDTAGLRNTDDPVESEGVCRALARASKADLAVVVLEAPEVLSAIKNETFEWHEYLRSHLIHLGIMKKNEASEQSPEWIENQCFLTVINKIDLVGEKNKTQIQSTLENSCSVMSLKTQEGFQTFLEKLTVFCGSLCDTGTAENPTLTAARHRTHISSCLEMLYLVLQPYDQEHFIDGKGRVSPPSHAYLVPEMQEDRNLLQSENTVVVAAHLLQRAATSLGCGDGAAKSSLLQGTAPDGTCGATPFGSY